MKETGWVSLGLTVPDCCMILVAPWLPPGVNLYRPKQVIAHLELHTRRAPKSDMAGNLEDTQFFF